MCGGDGLVIDTPDMCVCDGDGLVIDTLDMCVWW